jgi:inner membrane protein
VSNSNYANSIGTKIFILFGILLLSGIPSLFTEGLIGDRRRYEETANQSVVGGWAARHSLGQVTFSNHAYYFPELTDEGHKINPFRNARELTPNILNIKIKDQIEIRERGIFKIPIYKAHVETTGEFIIPKEFDLVQNSGGTKETSQTLMFKYSATETISDFSVLVNGESQPVKRKKDGLAVEFRAKTFRPGEKVQFQLLTKLNGYGGLEISSTTDELEVNMESAWPHPSFLGLLPMEQKISGQGFSARWKVIQPSENQLITINYVDPVNVYSLSERALKYGFLIAALCVGAVF